MNSFPFARYIRFIYTSTLERSEINGFYDFLVFVQSDLLSKNLTEKSERLAESGNEAVTQQVFYLSFYRDSFTKYHKPSH